MNSPAIVVVAFNRKNSLSRLLRSLSMANYPKEVELIISIDYSEKNEDVVDSAVSFDWNYGKKHIIRHKKNLGLKEHVLSCGRLTDVYKSIIMLEDDLVVSPEFYNYSLKALVEFSQDESIAGISLYNHQLNINERLRFEPFDDGYSNYFMQLPSSWGQVWTSRQWKAFDNWYQTFDVKRLKNISNLSSVIKNWSDKSWLKLFTAYMVINELYFVYPRTSLTTNCSDSGSHVKVSNTAFQVSLLQSLKSINFSKFIDSHCIYDSYFEIHPSCLTKYAEELASTMFCVNLYGSKELEDITSDYVLVSVTKPYNVKSSIIYERILWPQELNIIQSVPFSYNHNEAIVLIKTQDYFRSKKMYNSSKALRKYYFQFQLFKDLSFLWKDKIVNLLVQKIKSIR
ncbi:MAG: glycosyltransferase [Vibrio litoralis]|uniref:glycosyltransferase n=1 Tax=Vibrio litoralis TaxID=335972 RepID=UPI003F9D40AC